MFENLKIGWLAWRIWDGLKEGTMNLALITQLAALLIPVLTPVLIAGIKRIIPHLPPYIIPILAPVIGALAASITGVTDPVSGLVLGTAGVGLREVVDQGRKAINAPAP